MSCSRTGSGSSSNAPCTPSRTPITTSSSPARTGGYSIPAVSASGSKCCGARRACRTSALHDVRHSAAGLTLDAGVHPELLRRRLGHSKIGVTVDLYLRGRADEAERDVADRLAATIDAKTRVEARR